MAIGSVRCDRKMATTSRVSDTNTTQFTVRACEPAQQDCMNLRPIGLSRCNYILDRRWQVDLYIKLRDGEESNKTWPRTRRRVFSRVSKRRPTGTKGRSLRLSPEAIYQLSCSFCPPLRARKVFRIHLADRRYSTLTKLGLVALTT
jgi:hypothetical protein